jgi:hypothetical protein
MTDMTDRDQDLRPWGDPVTEGTLLAIAGSLRQVRDALAELERLRPGCGYGRMAADMERHLRGRGALAVASAEVVRMMESMREALLREAWVERRRDRPQSR